MVVAKPLAIRVIGHEVNREVFRLDDVDRQLLELEDKDDLVTGDTATRLFLEFPNGQKFAVTVSSEVYEAYLTCMQEMADAEAMRK